MGVFDTVTNAFSTIATTGDAATGHRKYKGLAVVGAKVIFVPFVQTNVGVLDTTTMTFTTVAIPVDGGVGNGEYRGAATLGSKVYFAPAAGWSIHHQPLMQQSFHPAFARRRLKPLATHDDST